METEIKAALTAVAGIVLTLLFAVISFRVIVPSVLEAHFAGSTIVATVVALMMAALIVAFATIWIRLVGRLLKPAQAPTDEKE